MWRGIANEHELKIFNFAIVSRAVSGIYGLDLHCPCCLDYRANHVHGMNLSMCSLYSYCSSTLDVGASVDLSSWTPTQRTINSRRGIQCSDVALVVRELMCVVEI